MSALGFYFARLTKEGTNQVRARLNELAAQLGYIAKAGPTAGEGNAAAMLVAIAKGELIVVRPDALHASAQQVS